MFNRKTGFVLLQGLLPVVSCIPSKKGADVKSYPAEGNSDFGIELQSFSAADNTMKGTLVFDRLKSYKGEDLYCSQMMINKDGYNEYVAVSAYDHAGPNRNLSCVLQEAELKSKFAAWTAANGRKVAYTSTFPYGSRVKCEPQPNPQGESRPSNTISCQRVGLYLLDGTAVPQPSYVSLFRIVGEFKWEPPGRPAPGSKQIVELNSFGAGSDLEKADLFCDSHYYSEKSKQIMNAWAVGIGWDFVDYRRVLCFRTKDAFMEQLRVTNNQLKDVLGTRVQCSKSPQCHQSFDEFGAPSHKCEDEYVCTFMEEIKRADGVR